MPEPLACRPATLTDVPRIAALVQAAYRGPGGWTNEIGLAEGRRIGIPELTELVRREDAELLVVDEDPGAGLTACCRVAAGADGVASLGLFAVAPASQARGLGRALVSVARTRAAERLGAHTLEISVVSGQTALLAWYGRLGFRDTGRTHPFGDDPEDRALVAGLHFVVMRMPLVHGAYALSWSGGKDSALALQSLRAAAGAGPAALITTVTADHDRVSMHGVRRALLRAQAASIGAALVEVTIPAGASNDVYERRFAEALHAPALEGVAEIAFGDLFLADIRSYREAQCAAAGRRARFPLWHDDTAALARRFVADGFDARIVCVDPAQLARSFAGRRFDAALLDDLPPSVDPCGERGEFHTFVSRGPGFASPVAVRCGEVVCRDGFVFADLLPA